MGGEDDGAFAHLGSKQNTANKLRRKGGGSTRRYNWYLVERETGSGRCRPMLISKEAQKDGHFQNTQTCLPKSAITRYLIFIQLVLESIAEHRTAP